MLDRLLGEKPRGVGDEFFYQLPLPASEHVRSAELVAASLRGAVRALARTIEMRRPAGTHRLEAAQSE